MRKITLISLALLCIIPSWSQENDKKIDSLLHQLTLKQHDTTKAGICFNLSVKYAHTDIKKAEFYAKLCYSFAQKAKFPKPLGKAYMSMADICAFKGDPQGKIFYAEKAAKVFKEAGVTWRYLEAVIFITSGYSKISEFKKALAVANEGLEYVKDKPKGDRVYRKMGQLYKKIGSIWVAQNDLAKALKYLNTSLYYSRKGSDNDLAAPYITMANIYLSSNDPKQALRYAGMALQNLEQQENTYSQDFAEVYNLMAISFFKLKNYTAAIANYQKAVDNIKDDKHKLAINVVFMAYCYAMLGQYDISIAKCKEVSVMLKNDIEDPGVEIIMYGALGKVYYEKKDYNLAKEYLQKARSLVESNEYPQQFYMLAELYGNLSKTEFQLGNFKDAYAYQGQFYTYERNDFIAEKENRVNELQTKFDVNEKDIKLKDYAIAQQKQQIEIVSQKNNLLLSLGGLGIFGLTSGGLWWAYRTNRKNNSILKGKNKIIENALAEKDLLLKEIHHRVKNNLQLVISLLSFQSSKFKDKELSDFLESGTGRIVSMALIHENLYQTDNVAAIDFREYAESLINNIIASLADEQHVKFKMDIDKVDFDIKRAIPLGLILNELVVNTIKHNYQSGSELKFDVTLKNENSKYELIYNDPQSTMTSEDTRKSSFGLELIHLLALQLKGKSKLSFANGLTATIAF